MGQLQTPSPPGEQPLISPLSALTKAARKAEKARAPDVFSLPPVYLLHSNKDVLNVQVVSLSNLLAIWKNYQSQGKGFSEILL